MTVAAEVTAAQKLAAICSAETRAEVADGGIAFMVHQQFVDELQYWDARRLYDKWTSNQGESK